MRPSLLILFSLGTLVGCNSAVPKVGEDSGTIGTDSGEDVQVDGSIAVSPTEIDLGVLFVGQTASGAIDITNVGEGAVDVTLSVLGGMATAYTLDAYTATPAAGETSTHTLTLTPTSWGDHGVSVLVEDAVSAGRVEVRVVASVQEDIDGDGFGSVQSGGADCNDADAAVNPDATETWYDGVDSDCDGADDYDQDADGVTVDADCDDTDASAYPGAEDAWYDGVDADCAGNDDYDQDADGYVPDAYVGLATVGVDGSGGLPGGDCDDTDASFNPGMPETWYDGIDSDCAGDDDYDADGDGSPYGTDCNDTNSSIYPGAADTWYDGVDADCAGNNDYDQDYDGVELSTDCNDTDPTVTGPVAEVMDGTDNDCDGYVDDFAASDLASGYLLGTSSSMQLGDHGKIAMSSDLTGDGNADLVVGATNSGYGYVYVVTGAAAAAAAGAVTSYDTAVISGETYYYLGWVNGPFGDVDADGDDDLLSGGAYSLTYSTYGYARVYMHDGGSSLSGSISASSYNARFTGDSDTDGTYQGASADFDGDGYADVVVGSGFDNYGGDRSTDYDAGSVALFSGDQIGADSYDLDEASQRVYGEEDYDYLGWSIVAADVTGDGYADAIAGAPGYDGTASSGGSVFVFAGGASPSWDTRAEDAAWAQFDGGSSSLSLGEDTLAHPGDVDGDGALDLGLASEDGGSVWVYLSSAGLTSGSHTTTDADWSFSGSAGDLGSMLVMDSDLDGDGTDDLAIGSDGDDTAGSNAGAVFIFLGGSWTTGVTSTSASARIWGTASSGYFGSGGAGGQDLDGDGREDLAIGEVTSDLGASDGGAVWIVPGW